MRPPLARTTSLLALVPCIAMASQLHGVATDLAGNPLQGVVVERVSTGESTTSGADGSWLLARSMGVDRRSKSGKAPTGALALREGRISFGVDGFRIDGKRERTAGQAIVFGSVAAARVQESSQDTIALQWMGVTFKRPITDDAPSLDLGTTLLDTNGLGRFQIQASRHRSSGMTVLRIDVISIEPVGRDSLVLRLHQEGTVDEMADFAMRLDFVQYYDAAGFHHPVKLDLAKISRVRPRLADETCPVDAKCHWTFDIPLEAEVQFGSQSRLELNFVLDRHWLTGDSTSLMNSHPTHDPFAGSDWSFRSHWHNATTDYPGVPVVAPEEADDLLMTVPVNPYIQLIRGGQVLYGRSPEQED